MSQRQPGPGRRRAGSRRRVRWRGPLTMLVLLGFLGAATWYGWTALTSPDDSSATASCIPPADARLVPQDVVLNVYNGTDRANLAGSTAEELEQRGFDIRSVGNDPLERQVKGIAFVRGSAESTAALRVLKVHLPKFTFVDDGRDDASLDIVLGQRFRALAEVKVGPAPSASRSRNDLC